MGWFKRKKNSILAAIAILSSITAISAALVIKEEYKSKRELERVLNEEGIVIKLSADERNLDLIRSTLRKKKIDKNILKANKILNQIKEYIADSKGNLFDAQYLRNSLTAEDLKKVESLFTQLKTEWKIIIEVMGILEEGNLNYNFIITDGELSVIAKAIMDIGSLIKEVKNIE